MMTIETKQKKKVTKQLFFQERQALVVEKITKIVEVVQSKNPATGKLGDVISEREIEFKKERIERFPLREVTVAELAKLRRKEDTPGFVLKEHGKYYYAEIRADLKLLCTDILGKHKCVIQNEECRRFSAESDERGGCAKVRNGSNYIEIYDWITVGYETFNAKINSFVVIECDHYQKP